MSIPLHQQCLWTWNARKGPCKLTHIGHECGHLKGGHVTHHCKHCGQSRYAG